MKGSCSTTVLFRSTFLKFILIAVSFPNLMPETFRQTGGSSFKTCTLGPFSGPDIALFSLHSFFVKDAFDLQVGYRDHVLFHHGAVDLHEVKHLHSVDLLRHLFIQELDVGTACPIVHPSLRVTDRS